MTLDLIMNTSLIGLGALLTLTLLELAWGVTRLGIGPTPSGAAARSSIAALCQQALQEREGPSVIYELGSGWGGLSLRLARCAGLDVEVRGLELAWSPLLISRARCYLAALRSPQLRLQERLSFTCGDLVEVIPKLKGGEVLVCYLCPEQMRRLSKALNAQRLPAQVTLISLLFSLPERTAHQRLQLRGLYRDPIWVYHLS